jgi:cyclic pyranopterin phosphate synthase
MMEDGRGRVIDYLRISVTDRCNLRCVYCMPEEGVELKPHRAMMTLEEIEHLVYVASGMGISRIRLTGGEPLVRLGICDLISSITKMDGIDSVALTTNGILLPRMAGDLKAAGLSRVNISLDTLDPEQFRQITRCGELKGTLDGIDAALEAGLSPVKINTVVVRSLHQDIMAFVKLTYERPLHLRFIEYMPVGVSTGSGHGWTHEDSVPSSELIQTINEKTEAAGLGVLVPLDRKDSPSPWGPARYYQLPGAKGTLGFIAPLSHHFCGECNRLRLTADGKIRPCLFSDTEYDVLEALRDGSDDEIREVIEKALRDKPDEHHGRVGTERTMSQIGG